jgi:hypothetical protein
MSLGNVSRGGISLYKKYLMHRSHTSLELFFLIDNLEKFALENGGRIDYQKTYSILRCTLDNFIQQIRSRGYLKAEDITKKTMVVRLEK